MDKTRLADVESCIAFQEKTIQDLSDVICRQQQEIDTLKAQYEKIMARLDDDEDQADAGDLPHETPPHY